MKLILHVHTSNTSYISKTKCLWYHRTQSYSKKVLKNEEWNQRLLADIPQCLASIPWEHGGPNLQPNTVPTWDFEVSSTQHWGANHTATCLQPNLSYFHTMLLPLQKNCLGGKKQKKNSLIKDALVQILLTRHLENKMNGATQKW